MHIQARRFSIRGSTRYLLSGSEALSRHPPVAFVELLEAPVVPLCLVWYSLLPFV
jgi:hypothetical protein